MFVVCVANVLPFCFCDPATKIWGIWYVSTSVCPDIRCMLCAADYFYNTFPYKAGCLCIYIEDVHVVRFEINTANEITVC
jgi:hypothetical protein